MFLATNFSLSIDKKGVASIVLDLPNEKINKLSAPVMAEIEQALNVIDGNKAVRILVISSAKKDIFVAGADINEIKDLRDPEDARKKVSRGQEIMNKIAALKIPTIAVINGACLGGGLELALACKYRVAVLSQKTQLGLPEVNLGIIPGFGGTQRLPKLVGLPESLKIILSGKSIDSRKALKIGLVDDLIREEFLTEKLSQFANEILKDPKTNRYLSARSVSRKKRFLTEGLFFGKYAIFYFAKKDLWKKTKGSYPAPFVALEVIKRTYEMTYGVRGFKTELDAFCELCVGDVSKNLIDIFFTNEALKKDSGIEGEGRGLEVENVAVIGAGVMGGGIAWLFANNDINVRVKDIAQNAIALGYNQIIKIFDQLKKIRKLTQEQINFKIGKVTTSLDYIGFSRADLVIEAVVENMAVKKKILAELETKVKKDAVIASNTSSLSISEMASALQNPERFAGMHFFNPVNRMPLVEVIRGEKTSDNTIATIVKLSKKLGKTPIVVKDVAGFLVNRVLLPYMNEAAFLLQEGAEITRIDSLIEGFGMPMGPFILADVVGIDVGVKVAHSLREAYGDRMPVADILEKIYQNHKDLLGKKVGKGFYIHGEQNRVNSQINEILLEVRKQKNIHQIYIRDEDIIDRAILMMVNEAAKCLEENEVKNARYLDMAMIMGCGFPAFRGGVLKYADSYGIDRVVSKLQEFSKKHGKRFEVSNLLIQMAQKRQKFYS
ncbi:MAG: enoyl-CoA hydratase/isomerase family protein [Proteobacteria bacterium]|nr:enoyl-CoA hydratase/isomerase family protein [Pseudomonadota bacterium]